MDGTNMPLQFAILINAVLIAVSFYLKLLSKSGLLAGFLIGTLIAFSLGLGGWIILLIFFLGGTSATWFQFEKKKALGVAQPEGGKRRWRHAWANAGCGVLCALASLAFGIYGKIDWQEAWRWAFVACFASALSDTLSSEFGQLAGQNPRLITTGEEVAIGVDGGITRAGILVGILGAILLTFVGRFLNVVPVKATLPVAVAGLSGNLFDSLLGATLQRRGLLDNDWVNFFNTIMGALLGLAGFWVMHELPKWMLGTGLEHQGILGLFI
jgi:uncharacterized protein (TIGR00297 family)